MDLQCVAAELQVIQWVLNGDPLVSYTISTGQPSVDTIRQPAGFSFSLVEFSPVGDGSIANFSLNLTIVLPALGPGMFLECVGIHNGAFREGITPEYFIISKFTFHTRCHTSIACHLEITLSYSNIPLYAPTLLYRCTTSSYIFQDALSISRIKPTILRAIYELE